MTSFFDYDKLQKDLDAAGKGRSVPGVMVEGQNTDMTSSEIDNKIAEDGIKKSLGSSQTSSASPQKIMAIAKAASKIGQSDVANMPEMDNSINLKAPEDVMSAKRNALMALLKR